MRANAWTTLEECTHLESLIPKFLTQQENRTVGSWLAGTANEFLKRFPTRAAKFDRKTLTVV